ncbi:MAG: glycosyltransferase family 2 protein [Ruminococcaceae bacterium]|nr:glycosyltransferase family 2 protein [Oscillospiraceae bacterium]
MRLSVLICVYNTDKKYLDECLRSITESTLDGIRGNYEICILDDGSDRDYSDIAKKYGAMLRKTENRGIYAAREAVLRMAQGEFCVYCDSDDTVSCDYHLPMLNEAEKTGTDIIINGWAFHTESARYYCRKDETVSGDIDLCSDEKLRTFFKYGGRYHSFYVLWNKLYRTELLKKAFLRLENEGYPKSASYAEDAAINFFAWREAKRIKNIHTGFYFYRIHASQSVNATTKERILSQIESMSFCFSIMRRNIGENRYKDEILHHLRDWEKLMARTHYSLAKANGHGTLFPIIKEKYSIDKLKNSTLMDAGGYIVTTLLGKNFKEIDRILLSIWKSKKPLSIKYSQSDAYTANCVRRLISSGKAIKTRGTPDVMIPKADIPKKHRFIHNGFVYRIGIVLFKKGSKARAFLKKFI